MPTFTTCFFAIFLTSQPRCLYILYAGVLPDPHPVRHLRRCFCNAYCSFRCPQRNDSSICNAQPHNQISFAVPFEEDLRNPSIWYLDHNFLEGGEERVHLWNAF